MSFPTAGLRLIARIFTILAATLFLPPAMAAEWPAGVVTIINPYEPGGAVDIVARELARGLSEEASTQIRQEVADGVENFGVTASPVPREP